MTYQEFKFNLENYSNYGETWVNTLRETYPKFAARFDKENQQSENI